MHKDLEHVNAICNTVDAFQGRQVEVVIYSVTRSNKKGKIGFLKEKERLNVALSRGEIALGIVGDERFCRSIQSYENPFAVVLDYMDRNSETCGIEALR